MGPLETFFTQVKLIVNVVDALSMQLSNCSRAHEKESNNTLMLCLIVNDSWLTLCNA